MAIRFEGNCTANVSDDAKYHIKASKGGHIEIPYEFDESDEWLLATKSHPDLVAMVNKVRLDLNENPGAHSTLTNTSRSSFPTAKTRSTTLPVPTRNRFGSPSKMALARSRSAGRLLI